MEWQGTNKPDALREDIVELRHKVADCAKNFQWETLLQETGFRSCINCPRLGTRTGWCTLHQAAFGNAHIDYVKQFIELGAFRTLRTFDGQTAMDIAIQQGHTYIVDLLKPVFKREVPKEVLEKMQEHLHVVMNGRAASQIQESMFLLPQLSVLLELENPHMWCPIPGMYGGFKIDMVGEGENAKVVAESWCRVVGGSGQRHEITANGSELVDQGFV